jgi:hypothetical protein
MKCHTYINECRGTFQVLQVDVLQYPSHTYCICEIK